MVTATESSTAIGCGASSSPAGSRARIGACGLASLPPRPGGLRAPNGSSLCRVGPGPRTLAAMTTKGLTRAMLAEPFTLWRARRVTIAIRERRRVAEYRRTEVSSITSTGTATPILLRSPLEATSAGPSPDQRSWEDQYSRVRATIFRLPADDASKILFGASSRTRGEPPGNSRPRRRLWTRLGGDRVSVRGAGPLQDGIRGRRLGAQAGPQADQVLCRFSRPGR